MRTDNAGGTGTRTAVRQTIQGILKDFAAVMDGWIGPDDRMADPFETDYSENYAPATGAVIYAGTYRFTEDPYCLNQCVRMIRRSVVLLKDRASFPFEKVFLLHYNLLALLLLPRKDRDALRPELQPFFAAYEDDCVRHVTNCAALQWATEMFFEEIGYRTADREVLRRSMDVMRLSATDSGFLNDEVDPSGAVKDGMPVAYHYFMVFILMCAAVCVDRSRLDEELRRQMELADTLIAGGLRWSAEACAPDGSYAMTERSRYQIFTWGVVTALSVYAGWDEGMLRKTVEWWLPYKQKDGTYGNTPNYLPHGLRAGFEGYTRVNMYNTLAMAGLVMAERLLEGAEIRPLGAADLPPSAREDSFVDPSTGLSFVRRGDSFFGCTMRMFHREYTPALQGFHFRLGGKPIPIADPSCRGWNADSDPLEQESVWEGYFLQGEDGRRHIPDLRQNAAAQPLPRGIRLQVEIPPYRVDKRIEITDSSVIWSYEILCRQRFATCRHVLPLLVYDGLNQATLREISPRVLEIRFGDVRYELRCEQASRIELSLNRSLLSGSGVTALLSLPVAAFVPAGDTIRWTTELRRV